MIMKKFDFLDLDARALQIFIEIFEAQSVTKASERIGITQSAVSHTLEKLRKITGNPLFVRSAQGVTPTTEAERMIEDARAMLQGLQRFAEPKPVFQPTYYSGSFRLGVTDYEQHIGVGRVFHRLRQQAPQSQLVLLEKPNTIEADHLLRKYDVAFSPYFSVQSGVYSTSLLVDEWFTYYDPALRDEPSTLETFIEAPHTVVMLGDHPRTVIDEKLAEQGLQRQVGLQVASFAMLPILLMGTNLIVTLPGRLRNSLLRDFSAVPCPLPLPKFTLNMLWHSRVHHDPAQRWLRSVIEEEIKE